MLALGGCYTSCSHVRALAAPLLHQDHVWINTEQVARFHKNEFNKILCKVVSTDNPGPFQPYKILCENTQNPFYGEPRNFCALHYHLVFSQNIFIRNGEIDKDVILRFFSIFPKQEVSKTQIRPHLDFLSSEGVNAKQMSVCGISSSRMRWSFETSDLWNPNSSKNAQRQLKSLSAPIDRGKRSSELSRISSQTPVKIVKFVTTHFITQLSRCVSQVERHSWRGERESDLAQRWLSWPMIQSEQLSVTTHPPKWTTMDHADLFGIGASCQKRPTCIRHET
jgi:hypothetical protein